MDANDLDQIYDLMRASPLEIKTEVDLLNSNISLIGGEAGNSSSYDGIINALQSISTSTEAFKADENRDYPPNHPLNGSKYLCSICDDRASGKHYGVHSCEGCKGFFKRTVRKDLTYVCRENNECIIDKRQRNRCQYCRYQKCLSCGMKREAVQDERQRRPKNLKSIDVALNTSTDPNILKFLEAENKSDRQSDLNSIPYLRIESNLSIQAEYKTHILHLCQAVNNQLYQILEYSLRINFFAQLHKEDQIMLLKSCWNELIIAGIAWRSIEFLSVAEVVDKRTKYNKPLKISISPKLTIHRSLIEEARLEIIFDRILLELSAKMKRLNIDKVELSCLKAIILFNSDIRGLKNGTAVGMARERTYETLNTYCLAQHPGEESRFAKLLLHLPTIRSISIKCVEHLHYFNLIGEKQLENHFAELIEPIRSLI